MAKTKALKKEYQSSAADVLAAVNQGTKARQSGKKRVNIEISDDTYRGLKAMSALQQETLTEYVNELFKNALDRNRTAIKTFEKASREMDELKQSWNDAINRNRETAETAADEMAKFAESITDDQKQALLDALQKSLNE